jgi:branched-chain amino acid transport system ATP-binding protein
MTEALLETRGLTVTYGKVKANDRVNLEVLPNRLVGLIGPNGAGKTTFIDALSGYARASEGEIVFGGDEISDFSPDRRARVGLARSFQSIELFDDLTVLDNVLVACVPAGWKTLVADLVHPRRRTPGYEQAEQALDLLGISDLRARFPTELSNGHRKLVGVARAIASRPSLVLLDEPASGLDTSESLRLGSMLRTILEDGTGIFLVDHDMGLVLTVCDYIYVLDFGRIIAQGTPAEVRRDPAVVAAYLGGVATN